MRGKILGSLIILALVLAVQGTAIAEEAATDTKAQVQALRKEANALTSKIRGAVEKCAKENAEVAELLKKSRDLYRQARETGAQAKEKAAATSPELAAMVEKQKGLRDQISKLTPKKARKPRKTGSAKKGGKKKE